MANPSAEYEYASFSKAASLSEEKKQQPPQVLSGDLGEDFNTVQHLVENGDHTDAMRMAAEVCLMLSDSADDEARFYQFREVFFDAVLGAMAEKPCWENQPDRWVLPFKDFFYAHWSRNTRDFRWMNPVLRAKHKLFRQMFFIALYELISATSKPILDGLLFIMHGNMWDGAFELFEPIAESVYSGLLSRKESGEYCNPLDWCVLGDVMLMVQRVEDAELCYKQALNNEKWQSRALLGLSAVQVDRCDFELARKYAAEAADLLATGKLAPIAATIRNILELWKARQQIKVPETIEVVIFCHCHQKLKKNVHLGPPGIGPLRDALDSMQAQFGAPDDIPVTIYYDHRESEVGDAYYRNLKNFADDRGARLFRNVGNGLRKQWLHAFSEAKSDVVFVVEHDHVFLQG